MNCFAHALPHLDDAYMAVGSCLPDWLSACDRKCRVHEKDSVQFIADPDPIVSTTARGVVRHHQDDEWFHKSPFFNELVRDFAEELRKVLGKDKNVRPSFIGHVVIELFLDSYLSARYPGKMEYFYKQIATVDGRKVQDAINLFSSKPCDKLAPASNDFMTERFLFDYDTDQGIVYRLNRVFSRIRLAPLDHAILSWMPQARQRVSDNATALLPKYPIQLT